VIDDYEVLSGLGASNLGHDASSERPFAPGPRNEGGWQVITNRCSSLLTRSAALTLFLIALPGVACAFDPYGTWMRPSTGTQVNFYDCGGKLCAKIVAVKDERRKSKIGTVIITGATKSADNQWKGDLLNADDGKIYTGVVTMQAPNALNLKGCVAFICQGETWTKVK
jgi:uncharacterized protein (DUF2147 family)